MGGRPFGLQPAGNEGLPDLPHPPAHCPIVFLFCKYHRKRLLLPEKRHLVGPPWGSIVHRLPFSVLPFSMQTKVTVKAGVTLTLAWDVNLTVQGHLILAGTQDKGQGGFSPPQRWLNRERLSLKWCFFHRMFNISFRGFFLIPSQKIHTHTHTLVGPLRGVEYIPRPFGPGCAICASPAIVIQVVGEVKSTGPKKVWLGYELDLHECGGPLQRVPFN